MSSLKPGWLAEDLARVEEEIKAWPAWKRELLERSMSQPAYVDPCDRPTRCHEAQTCVGTCLGGRRTRGGRDE